jgi:hypothetical protein
MIALWVVTTVAGLAALLLWRRIRRLDEQLEQLSHRYWELKYEQLELRAQLQRSGAPAAGEPAPPPPALRSGEGFVPLASLKR